VNRSQRDVALLLNPSAGKGHALRWHGELTRRLTDSGCRVRSLVGRNAAESSALAAAAIAAGVEELVLVGGDGLVHQVLPHTVGTSVALGVIPVGTGNDLARALSIPARDPLAAVDVVIGRHSRLVDVGRAGDTYFATVLATGFDSRVSERAATVRWPHGQLRYTAATLAELRVFTPLTYRLGIDGNQRELDAMLVAVSNTPSYGGGLRICPDAKIDDGRLDVVVIKPVSKLELVKVYPRLFTGTHVSHPAYERFGAHGVSLAAAGVVAYADGERLGALPIGVEVVPSALRVFAPAPASRSASSP
jgi:diacylglycerol kinase (ATP)